ncbi:hypothetical protein [Aquabacter spiritensis]|uniref:Uncharacterized protein n=1 Tax=Aquabacter spiritensis TaxID=933073 RepID=A0A4R3LR91_9HYPH|nr:hypothetical protein [Aquabacter spiritensis]TCT02149.1 hypothetical protein EDC64_1148 [Aquabacter spiritensis]
MTDRDDVAPRSQVNLDAAIAAHRQLLVLMFRVLGHDPARRDALVEAIDQKLTFHDGHEDPGLEADGAFAFERRVNAEFRRVLEDVRAGLGRAA